jgi:hypothetical protein
MKESTKEDLANHFGHESYADDGNVAGVATAVVYAGNLFSSGPHPYRVPALSVLREGKMFHCDFGKRWNGSAESKNLSMRRTSIARTERSFQLPTMASNHRWNDQ